ncbi:hypothetical protein [Phaeobacter gallaeciensis]|uniref:Uncharacterized protein n=1 Tax=Phaeobacter gallaeciensis TaxID=60890 RepID=A0AAC9ZBF4_9RHOB|nr:hypothetical protein [Phaeobacter gallaeciensis]AHD10930.1 hypothetical protein Gal_03202 [Phaeobacter gallaeciensis DSM 26640]ATE94193.1 hypothetical protein PhaeoP11_03190 [Phaeobacter gallaeciensis]ATE95986.1 hypothetical protein PhaeoP73_00657 [Phaeobacter gallaeciensis]ATF02857.1 hypothetical protein PhaeoP75_03239 [Phaeobacter gallaeciensis]ATF07237.1 hypothetical protein PhaeoP63_03188 [Phaeobacter gallaeciensis]
MSETVFPPDRMAYWRSHAWLAVIAMVGAIGILWIMGNPHVWTGAIGGLAAIGLRGGYLMSDEMTRVWSLEGGAIKGPDQQTIPLADIAELNRLGSTVQIVTHQGHKHLIKYQPDPGATLNAIERAKV